MEYLSVEENIYHNMTLCKHIMTTTLTSTFSSGISLSTAKKLKSPTHPMQPHIDSTQYGPRSIIVRKLITILFVVGQLPTKLTAQTQALQSVH